FRRNAAVHHPGPVGPAILGGDTLQEVGQRGVVGGIAGHHFIGQRQALRGDDQGNHHLDTVRSLVATEGDLLANDSDPDGDALSFVSITPPGNGALTNSGGSLTYTPNSGFLGNDAFTYTVSDGVNTASANVIVTVTEPGAEPPPEGGQSPDWQLVSSTNGGLPIAATPENTAAQVLDVDQDGLMDFIIAGRRSDPAVTWYRQKTDGNFEIITIDPADLDIEAGGTVYDVDGDGDLDVLMGGDSSSNEVWWWENPYPLFDPAAAWSRHVIKSSGGISNTT
ncbi:MAG: hypothetical protein GY788_08775, partial [bacterium]|nr:hypothetical protein [bacterium]